MRPAIEEVPLEKCGGRVLSSPLVADRDYPAVSRSVRDGFAVRSADVPGRLRIIGEVRAGEVFPGQVGPGEAVEIMTGAPLPKGADAVVMLEHATREGENVSAPAASAGQFVSARGCEAREGDPLLAACQRLGYAEIAALAAAGQARVQVYRQPRVAIIATGNELLALDEHPLPHQVRDSNSYSLAAQVRRAGGIPEILPAAADSHASLRESIERGLASDLLLLSGGVSAGKYDLVEQALAELGAEFFFDRVRIQPGQPLVFGRVRGKFFFGLPGNPASTMVTFEVFARAAVELLEGQWETMLPVTLARLTAEFRHKTGIARFLPARLSEDGASITPLVWQGSSDIPALARANAFLVADPGRESWQAGDLIQVMLK
jgi:molybdopterin molybdotransferase